MIASVFKKCSWCSADAGLLVLRIGVAIIFIFAGWTKLSDMGMTVDQFGTMGLGAFWAWLVALVEFVGGIAVLLGICTRYAALLLAIIMLVAGYFTMSDPMAVMTPFMLFFVNLALVLAGGGRFSLVGKFCRCGGKCAMCEASDVVAK